MAAVAARDRDSAEEALSLIEVDYEILPAVFNPQSAIAAGAPLVHEGTAGNVSYSPCFHWGNVEEGFAASDRIREDSFRFSRRQEGRFSAECRAGDRTRLEPWPFSSPYGSRRHAWGRFWEASCGGMIIALMNLSHPRLWDSY